MEMSARNFDDCVRVSMREGDVGKCLKRLNKCKSEFSLKSGEIFSLFIFVHVTTLRYLALANIFEESVVITSSALTHMKCWSCIFIVVPHVCQTRQATRRRCVVW